MYVIIWEYRVKEENRSEFEKAYGPNGAWAELFKNAEGYLGTELLQSANTPEIYSTIDKWDSKESYGNFLGRLKIEYEKLDEQCDVLTEQERHIGNFNEVRSSDTIRLGTR